jgi:hypothetical protein
MRPRPPRWKPAVTMPTRCSSNVRRGNIFPWRPDGAKQEKDKQKKQAEASGIRDKMDDLMKSREHLVNKTLEVKMMMMEKKSQGKQMRWELL